MKTFHCTLCNRNTPEPLEETRFISLKVCGACVRRLAEACRHGWAAVVAERREKVPA